MKTSAHGNKTDGSIVAGTLCIIACISMVLFVSSAVICAKYQLAKKQYESFYGQETVYEVD